MNTITNTLPPVSQNNTLGLYLHIPFCRSKCLYCDFCSLPSAKEETVERYIDALCTQIKIMGERAKERTVDTVFIGGGTPTFLTSAQLGKIITELEKSFAVSKDAEFTAEANPATFDRQKLTEMRAMGVNRLSIGMQSAIANELRLLGRTHTAEDIKKAVDAVNLAKIDNFNLDLMYGIPSQTVDSFKETLNFVCSLSPDHISVYGLQLEEGTPLYKRQEKYTFPTEDEEKEMNRTALSVLGKSGYNRYEISNYAKEGKECRHNIKYWKRDDYIGMGVAAHSFFERERYGATENIDEYISAVQTDSDCLYQDRQKITPDEAAAEYIMLRMRLTEGVSPEGFTAETGLSFTPYAKRMEQFIASGHIEYKNKRYAFTPNGFDVSNYILSEIV